MKSKLITLFFVAIAIIGAAYAQNYERVITFYKDAELIDEYKISELDSIKFETEYSGISTEGYYRIKNVETGLYLNAEDYNFHYTGTRGGVTCVAYAEDADQIFKIEESGSNFKLKTNSGYYIYCQTWIVDAQTTGTDLLLVENNDATYDIKFGSNYFGVSQDNGVYYPYCNAQYNNRATWVLEEATQMPTYTISASATVGGTATASASSMAKGGSITLIATPATGYRFVNWTVGGVEVSTESIYVATITVNTQFVANFEERTTDTEISLTKEYRIKHVESGNYLNASNNLTHVGGTNGGVNCVAYAENNNQIFVFEASGTNYYLKSKSGYYIYCQQWNVDALTYGSELTFIDNPDGTYYIKNGANYFKVEDVNGVYYPFCDAPADLKATWVLEPVGGEEPEPTPTYTVSVSATAGGTASASAESVEEGGSVTLTATANSGYEFVNWTLNGVVVSTENPYTATITANSEFVANFEKYVTLWRNASSDLPGHGTFTVILNSTNETLASSSRIPAGSELTLTATPSDLTSVFKYWKITTFIGATTEETVTITDNPATITVTDNTNISPVFDLVRYKISVKTNGGGTAVASIAEAKPNEDVIFTATPADGYAFLNWTVNGEEVSTEFSHTEYYRTEDFEITANFIEYKKTGTLKNHDYVDLGLPSGTKWSTHSVGATIPEEIGEYFAWGETVPKDTYTSDNYKYEKTEWDSYNGVYWYYDYGKDGRTELESMDDAARVSWGEGWRMPTKEEVEELCNTDNCIWTSTIINEVSVYKVTSKTNGNYIFIVSNTVGGENGRYPNAYWTRNLKDNDEAYYMHPAPNNGVSFEYRTRGLNVRAVCE